MLDRWIFFSFTTWSFIKRNCMQIVLIFFNVMYAIVSSMNSCHFLSVQQVWFRPERFHPVRIVSQFLSNRPEHKAARSIYQSRIYECKKQSKKTNKHWNNKLRSADQIYMFTSWSARNPLQSSSFGPSSESGKCGDTDGLYDLTKYFR